MTMQISDEGVGLIKAFEGCRTTAYYDSVGVLTIGYGCTTDVAPGMKITQVQAEERLKLDLKDAEAAVNLLVVVPLSQNEYDALTSFTFNLGQGALRRSTLLKLLNESDYTGAAKEFLRFDKAGGKVLAGLSRRRMAEMRLFNRGEDDAA